MYRPAGARRKGHRERDGEATLVLLGNRMNGDYLPWNITSKLTCKFGQVGGLVIRRSLFFFFSFCELPASEIFFAQICVLLHRLRNFKYYYRMRVHRRR